VSSKGGRFVLGRERKKKKEPKNPKCCKPERRGESGCRLWVGRRGIAEKEKEPVHDSLTSKNGGKGTGGEKTVQRKILQHVGEKRKEAHRRRKSTRLKK